ncbi:hypothetical protein Y032_0119g861 [Ancylostoma ceylanicum]|uniref:Uncharacterized protein n=1 Tax=Ancylostoma ceylanicum TaxID=53326 RepID=A0A016TB91_9BILA|nr:hypothetical protein Y032_0119g861 [Ancylostoma ceylanicum]
MNSLIKFCRPSAMTEVSPMSAVMRVVTTTWATWVTTTWPLWLTATWPLPVPVSTSDDNFYAVMVSVQG